jgi:hypothetical protein
MKIAALITALALAGGSAFAAGNSSTSGAASDTGNQSTAASTGTAGTTGGAIDKTKRAVHRAGHATRNTAHRTGSAARRMKHGGDHTAASGGDTRSMGASGPDSASDMQDSAWRARMDQAYNDWKSRQK